MSILNNSLLLSAPAATGYSISRSLRFNSSDSAYLSRAVTASNRKKWSFSFWFKKTTNSQTDHYILDSSAWTTLTFNNNALGLYDAGAGAFLRLSSQVFRDTSAWYYILVVYDSDNATAQNRLRFYCNGTEITAWQANTTIASGYETRINGTYTHTIGTALGYPAGTINGYLADIHFIDGQALTPSSFGEFDTNGIWQPKAYSGSYGTNGFRLPFSDNSAATATTLGKDSAGSNNWTPNNLSVTAGAGNDSLVDSPTNGTASSGGDAGGVVVGNYCTLNPLKQANNTLTNGNLDWSDPSSDGKVLGTIGMSSGKWYWECTMNASNSIIGIAKDSATLAASPGYDANSWAYIASNGLKIANSSGSAYGSTYTTGDVIGVAFDADAGSLYFYKNGTIQNSGTAAFTGLTSGPYFPAFGNTGGAGSANFGARPFAYAAPSGFKSLNTANLPTPTILKGSTAFDVLLWTGSSTSSSRTLTGLGLSPDFVWAKNRSGSGYSHNLYDTNRGVGKMLVSNATDSEYTNNQFGYISAFNSDGFTTTPGSTNNSFFNELNASYVAWCWDAGSSTVTNTAGSISAQVRASASSGFSVVTWSGVAGANGTIGHGLGVIPQMAILKNRGTTDNWRVYHVSVGATGFLQLASTGATVTSDEFQNTTPTSSVFYLRGNTWNAASNNYVGYFFAPVAGYSAFGSYTGNGSADGPFVYCGTGFRPRWILIKKTDSTLVLGNWILWDTARSSYNSAISLLIPNLSNAESDNSSYAIDALSNGFKIRSTGNDYNLSGSSFVYACFAENPFSIARAR